MKKGQWTIGALGKRFGLSRSTLLYYDSIGLLSPNGRKANNYRVFTDEDCARLQQICDYRQTGLPLKEIAGILDASKSSLTQVLANRLAELNGEIERLREQQRFILGILKKGDASYDKPLSKESWVEILTAAGFSREDMLRWHAAFERQAPERHREFLEFLNIDAQNIRQIRELAASLNAQDES
ncbi:MAG TPA: MerR family transcriptional regulator [bacterium]|nr:MerR family transcriptional regulator [bacterium]